jgi:ABC-type dipeptide/oligopeptide/nickel transport system permease component
MKKILNEIWETMPNTCAVIMAGLAMLLIFGILAVLGIIQ